MKVILIRFLIGAVAVSIFAVLGDLLKPKKFRRTVWRSAIRRTRTLGLTLAITLAVTSAATEAGSMIAGAIAFFVYASCVSWILMSGRFLALWVTIPSLSVWAGVAFGLWYGWLK